MCSILDNKKADSNVYQFLRDECHQNRKEYEYILDHVIDEALR